MEDARAPRPAAPEVPPPVVAFQPAHLTTSTGITPIRVVVEAWGLPFPDETLQELASAVQLRDANGEAVSFGTEVFNPPSREVSVDHEKKEPVPSTPSVTRPFVEVIPEQELSDGWHTLFLTHLPDGLDVVAWREENPSAGSHSVRFHPASAPTLIRGMLCGKGGDEAASVSFEFSENVFFLGGEETPPIQVYQVDSTTPPCSFLSVSSTGTTRLAALDCSSLDGTKPWRIEMDLGSVQSAAAAVPASLPSGQATLSTTITPTALPLHAGDPACRVWVVGADTP